MKLVNHENTMGDNQLVILFDDLPATYLAEDNCAEKTC